MREVYLHGFLGQPQSFSSLWSALDLESTQPRIGLCLPFHGGPDAATFSQACEHLWAQSALQTPGPVHLIGYSLGARLALGMAFAQPQRVARLTLIGVNPGIEDEGAITARREADLRWGQLALHEGLTAFYRRWDAQPLFAHRQSWCRTMRLALDQQRSHLRAQDVDLALRVLGLAAMPSGWHQLPALAMPVHLVTGQHDGKFTQLAAMMSQTMQHTHVSVIADAHHDVLATHPTALAQAMLAFAAVCH